MCIKSNSTFLKARCIDLIFGEPWLIGSLEIDSLIITRYQILQLQMVAHDNRSCAAVILGAVLSRLMIVVL